MACYPKPDMAIYHRSTSASTTGVWYVEMAWKWSDGTRAACLRAPAAWAIYNLLASPNKPGLVVLVEAVEVLLAAVFLSALAQTLFCPERVRAPRGDVAVLPLVDGQSRPHRVTDDGGEPPVAPPAQGTAGAPVEPGVVTEVRGAVSCEDGGVAECAV